MRSDAWGCRGDKGGLGWVGWDDQDAERRRHNIQALGAGRRGGKGQPWWLGPSRAALLASHSRRPGGRATGHHQTGQHLFKIKEKTWRCGAPAGRGSGACRSPAACPALRQGAAAAASCSAATCASERRPLLGQRRPRAYGGRRRADRAPF